MELVCKKPTEINRFFGVPKGGDIKQRPILDGRRSNCQFLDPENPELLHPGMFMQLENAEKEELYVMKLNIDIF